MTEVLEKQFDELERSYVEDLKRSQALGKLAGDAKTAGAADRAREIGWEALAFSIPPVHPLSRRKDLKMRFYNLTNFPKEAIDHFETRARSSKNSFVVARFADIVWEARRDFNFAKLAISAYLDSVGIQKNNLADDRVLRLIDLTDAAQRATEIAVSLGDTTSVAHAEEVCVELLVWIDSVKEYRWGLEIIEALLEIKKFTNRASLKSAFEFGERSLEYLVHQNAENFKIQLDYVTLLARLATSLGDSISAEKWRKEVPATLAREAQWKESKPQYKGLALSIIYQQAAKAYLDIGMKEESDKMLQISIKKMQEAEFHKIEVPIEIPREFVDREVKKYTENKSPAEILAGLSNALELVPDYECALDIARKTGGISSIMPVGLYDGTRRIASAATPEEILQARAARQFALNCKVYCSLLLIPILDKAIELGCSKDAFVDHFRKAQGLKSDHIEALQVGVERFLARDYVSCIHVLVIQVEAWLRDLLDSMGGHTTYVKDQVVHVHTIDTIINDELIKRALVTRLWKYLNAIMNDDLAFGLRDKVAHGLCEASEFDKYNAALLLHACLLLTKVVPTKP
jgi:hypothetical protein